MLQHELVALSGFILSYDPSSIPLSGLVPGQTLSGMTLMNVLLAGMLWYAMQEPELAQRVGAIYSYGQPRVGDAAFRDAFCSAYGDRTWRLRNAGDIVPFLLPRWLGYRCEPLQSAFILLHWTMHQTDSQILDILTRRSVNTCPCSSNSPSALCIARKISQSACQRAPIHVSCRLIRVFCSVQARRHRNIPLQLPGHAYEA